MKKSVTVSGRSLQWLLDYAEEERDVDFQSNYSPLTKRVEPYAVRRRIEKFDKISDELRAALS